MANSSADGKLPSQQARLPVARAVLLRNRANSHGLPHCSRRGQTRSPPFFLEHIHRQTRSAPHANFDMKSFCAVRLSTLAAAQPLGEPVGHPRPHHMIEVVATVVAIGRYVEFDVGMARKGLP